MEGGWNCSRIKRRLIKYRSSIKIKTAVIKFRNDLSGMYKMIGGHICFSNISESFKNKFVSDIQRLHKRHFGNVWRVIE
jgi:hypothetical protein